MSEQRKDSRSAASLKVKYKSATVDEFVHQFGTDVSRGGIFIKTKSPLAAGALLKLELQLADSSAVIAGVGRVAWRRAASTDPSLPAGMGVKFIKLEPASEAVIERIVGTRGASSSRFDHSEGAELAPPSIAPPSTSVAPAAPAPAAPAPAAPAPAAPAPAAPAPAPRASAPQAPRPSVAPAAAAAAAPARPAARGTVPTGLFANSPLVKPVAPAVAPEPRSSFFPPAPSAPVARASTASSPGLRNTPSRAPAPDRASAAHGPKGVFGGAPATGRDASGLSSSGMLHAPAIEEPSVASRSRGDSRVDPASVPPAPDALFSEEAAHEPEHNVPAASDETVDGLFAALEGEDPFAQSAQPEPEPEPTESALDASGAPSSVDELFSQLEGDDEDAPAAEPIAASSRAGSVDELFSQLEGDDADDAEAELEDAGEEPGVPASAVFAPGSTRPIAAAAIEDDQEEELRSSPGEDFGEAELFASLRAPAAAPEPPPRRSALPMVLGGLVVLLALVAALAALKPELFVQLGIPLPIAKQEPIATPLPPEPEAATGIAPSEQPPTDEAREAPAAPAAAPAPAHDAGADAQVAAPAPSEAAPAPSEAAPAPSEAAPAPTAAVPAQPPASAALAAAALEPFPTDPAQLAKVEITSTPRGAELRVGSKVLGSTPTHVSLPIGRAVPITVSMPGYVPSTLSFTAQDGQNEPLRFKLEPLPYILIVRSKPEGAELSAAGATAVSPAPLRLGHVSGDLSVSISKPGFRMMGRPVRLEEFKLVDGAMRAEIEVTLSPLPTAPAPKPVKRVIRRPAPKPAAAAAPAPAAPAPPALPPEPPAPPPAL